jgi:peptidoglycan/xylan/chitin deacetylase (PgdA/CDA1 family)
MTTSISDAFHYCFPCGKRKALVMSYDDGSEHDRRLVDLFNRYGIRASFHLNSGRLGEPHHISPAEVRSLYQGHEVSCHTVNHPNLTQLSENAIRREIVEDRKRLEDLIGAPVRGLAYPFGIYNESVVSLLPELGIEYARTAISTYRLTIPEHFLLWETTCHHNAAFDMGEMFLANHNQELALLYVWGHSYELAGFMSSDPAKNWQYMEALCHLLHGHDSVYYTTTIDLADYLNALKKIELLPKEKVIANGSDSTVWISCKDTVIRLPPGERCPLEGSA